MRLAILTLALVLFLQLPGEAVERCKQYIPEVRKWSSHYLGLSWPWHFNLGQLEQESSCRTDVTAFDGGQGIAQFMPSTERLAEKSLGPLNLYNPSHSIKAQAWLLATLQKENWCKYPWMTYQGYNGGFALLKKEWQKAGNLCDNDLMRSCCKRNVITLKSGKTLDLCDVNYDYPHKVFEKGKSYWRIVDTIAFWGY